jgi:hypothetical protein
MFDLLSPHWLGSACLFGEVRIFALACVNVFMRVNDQQPA